MCADEGQGQGFCEKWNARYRGRPIEAVRPARVLNENLHLLPRSGQALELACGLGANAIALARSGLETLAWDLSDVAIAKLQNYGRRHGLALFAEQRDVVTDPPPPKRFDVIVVTHFLERSLAPALAQALRPGGLLYYQTFVREALDEHGPANPAFRLAPNELLRLFTDLRVVVYREEGRIGDVRVGFRNEAMLVAMRPE
jgi:SAM-dependent methyltransferase